MGWNAKAVSVVRDSVDLVQIANRLGARLQPIDAASTLYNGVCPYHHIKDHGFLVDSARQLFYCFGSESQLPVVGDAIDLYQLIMSRSSQPITAATAIREIAEARGINLEEPNEQKSSLEVNEAAQRYFSEQLFNHEPALRYLRERSLSDGVIRNWGLGFAPSAYNKNKISLLDYLLAQEFTLPQIAQSGLAATKLERSLQSNDYYSFFQDRIMIPITDGSGTIIGFSGRDITSSAKAKYINTPAATPFGTTIYNKRAVLFGLRQALPAIRSSGLACVTEGYFDVISAHQAGLENVVGTAGTAFTINQAGLLRRHTSSVNFIFDSDSAGITASKKAASIAYAVELNPTFTLIDGGKDLDEIIRKSGPQAKLKIESLASLDIVDFVLQTSVSTAKLPEEKLRLLEEAVTLMRPCPDFARKIIWMKYLAERLNIDPRAVEEKYFSKLDAARARKDAVHFAEPSRISDVAELYLVGLLTVPGIYAQTVSRDIPVTSSAFSPSLQQVYQLIIEESQLQQPSLPFKVRPLNVTRDFIDEASVTAASEFFQREYDAKRLDHYPASLIRLLRAPLRLGLIRSADILKAYVAQEEKDQLMAKLHRAVAAKDHLQAKTLVQELEEKLCHKKS